MAVQGDGQNASNTSKSGSDDKAADGNAAATATSDEAA